VALDPVHPPELHTIAGYDRLIAYYEGAGLDFEHWSPAFNMHFGYYRRGLNPFRREPMLNEMNRQVLDRLRLEAPRASASQNRDDDLILDLGCGVGATVRYAARRFPHASVLGLTVVPWQIKYGEELNRRAGLDGRAKLMLADYTESGLPSATAAGAYAIESSCHAEGRDKTALIQEAARLLRRGARLVVADGFIKNPQIPLGRAFSRLHEEICRSFVLPEMAVINDFIDALTRHGFADVTVEDISWRVAPSALHAPLAVLWFRAQKLWRHQQLSEASNNNLRGSCSSPSSARTDASSPTISCRRRGSKGIGVSPLTASARSQQHAAPDAPDSRSRRPNGVS
jgi:SAM-dependent methyltransferase